MPYIGKTTDGFGIRERFTYLASAGATSISGADANGKTLLYEDPEYVDVFLNGIRLKKGTDYNTSTANTIAGLAALALNDEIEVIVQDVFTLADMVSANTGGDFRGSIAIQKDSGVLSFGADKEITVTHSADTGLVFKNTNTGDDKPFTLTLQTGETDIAASDKLGVINFQAPDEGTGTDAILVAAGIEAVSEGDFSSSNNATKLSFKTAASGAAAETMSLSSGGNLAVSGTYTGGGLMITGGNIIIPDDGTIGSASDQNAVAISAAGVVTISTNTDSTSSTSGALIAHSAGFADDVFIGDTLNIAGSDGVDISQGAISIKNGGTQSYVRFYCESSNAHYAQLQAPAHADFSGNITLTLPAVTDTVAGIAATQTLTNKTLTSPKINENVAVTSTATELNLLDGVTATTAEINFLDGGSTIGTTAIADGDGIIHNDGGTMKVTSAATFKTYFQAGLSNAADDISAGDAAVNITTSSGNITIDAAANDSDIIFKGTDNTADITMLTLDGSEAGAASFNGTVTANAGIIVDNITIDGTEIDLSSGDFTLDVAGNIFLDADGGDIRLVDGGTQFGLLQNNSSDFVIQSSVSDKDILLKGNDDSSGITALTLDMSEAGKALFNAGATFASQVSITTADNSPQLVLTSTDADANRGPILTLTRSSGSPADNDIAGTIKFNAKNDAAEDIELFEINTTITDASDGTEDAKMTINGIIGGASTNRLNLTNTETVFNDDGVDLDFRVESDTNANAFFMEASTGRIGMGTNAMGDYHANRDDLVIATSGSTGITLVAGGSGHQSAIAFADGSGDSEEDAGLLMYNHNGNIMSFNVGDSQVAQFSSVNMGIFSTDQTARLNVESNFSSYTGLQIKNNNSGNSGTFAVFVNSAGGAAGSISQTGAGTVAFNASSDYRLKENVSYDFDATTRLKQLKPCRFNFIEDGKDTAQDGFLAHEVSDIVPIAITGDKDATEEIGTIKDADGNIVDSDVTELQFTERKQDNIYTSDYTWTKTSTREVYQQIDQSKLVPLLVKTIQELEARIKTLEDA